MQAILSMSGYASALEMSEREEKIKKEVKTDEYGNVRKEEVRREVSTKSEAERDLEDAGDKMKAGAKAIGAKMEDPDRDMGAQYEKKKAEEKLKDYDSHLTKRHLDAFPTFIGRLESSKESRLDLKLIKE